MSPKKRSFCVIFLLVASLFLAPTSCFMVSEKIGVLFIHHGGMNTLKNQYMWDAAVTMFTYDPKINDTIIANENIEALLLARHPEMDPDNIVGAFGGAKEVHAESGLFEFTREQRGDRFGTAFLYESDKQMPASRWGYRYWDALEYLKNRGVKHIAVGFPQVCQSSALDLIEIPNQFGKEIGMKNWAKWETGDFEKYPDVGHPFADYWGVSTPQPGICTHLPMMIPV